MLKVVVVVMMVVVVVVVVMARTLQVCNAYCNWNSC